MRLSDGTLQEVVLSEHEVLLLERREELAPAIRLIEATGLQLLVESAGIRLAYAHERQFAVSLFAIRTLPRRIEAVYRRMLLQPCLRFLLAEDPGAAKTIVGVLLIEELKLRDAILRVLILCPAPLAIQKLSKYEEATGIALALANVDFLFFQQANAEADERRLMPKYLERQFVEAAKHIGLRVEPQAEGLGRVPYVPADLRSEHLRCVQRVGKSETEYRKITFYKEKLEQDQQLDAVLLGPGNPLYTAVNEKVNVMLSGAVGGTAFFLDSLAAGPYRLHFFESAAKGMDNLGRDVQLFPEVAAVLEDAGQFEFVPADMLLNLASHPAQRTEIEPLDLQLATEHLKSTDQVEIRRRCQEERQQFAAIVRNYLERSFQARIRKAQER